jgi:hypothetical protein
MSSVRKAGTPVFKSSRAAASPFSAFDSGVAGEVRVNGAQMNSLEFLYNTSPPLQAARAILVGQLLSSGISLTRDGEAVKLKPAFEKHIQRVWMPFARAVVDSLIKWGLVVVSLEEEAPPPFAAFNGSASKKRRLVGEPQTDGNAANAERLRGSGALNSQAPPPPTQGTVVPVVPTLMTYEIALTPSGRAGYTREARVFTTAPAHAYVEDVYSHVFFRTVPDAAGNVVSPVSAAFDQVSFVNQLRELALSAEAITATPTLVTQSAPRVANASSGAVDASQLFFDSESRAIQQQSADEEASERAAQLSLAAHLAGEVNRLRTTNLPSASAAAPVAPLPPDVPPRLFALPDKQTLVPNALQPSARGDLEALMRASNESIACAMGVPGTRHRALFPRLPPPLTKRESIRACSQRV